MGQYFLAAKKSELTIGCPHRVNVNGQEIVLCYVEDRIFALGDSCPHAGGPLADGTLQGTKLTCPWHGAEFDITNGQVLTPPAGEGVRSYPVKISGNEILIQLD